MRSRAPPPRTRLCGTASTVPIGRGWFDTIRPQCERLRSVPCALWLSPRSTDHVRYTVEIRDLEIGFWRVGSSFLKLGVKSSQLGSSFLILRNPPQPKISLRRLRRRSRNKHKLVVPTWPDARRSAAWSVRNQGPGFDRLSFLSASRHWAIARPPSISYFASVGDCWSQAYM